MLLTWAQGLKQCRFSLSFPLSLSLSCVSVCVSFSFSSAEGVFPPSDEHGKARQVGVEGKKSHASTLFG